MPEDAPDLVWEGVWFNYLGKILDDTGVPGGVPPSLMSVTHRTILESLSQRGELAIGGVGG